MNVAAILPLALVMVAGPQIVAAVFFATSVKWKATSAAYLLGGAISIVGFFTTAYFITKAAKHGPQNSSNVHVMIESVILALLLFLLIYVFLTRKRAHPPKWMSKLEGATPRFAFILGLLLLGVFPTDIITSVTVGAHEADYSAEWVDGLPFVGLSLLLLALPALLVLVLGKRAHVLLPKARDWMNTNSWIINEIVIAFFIGLTIKSLVS